MENTNSQHWETCGVFNARYFGCICGLKGLRHNLRFAQFLLGSVCSCFAQHGGHQTPEIRQLFESRGRSAAYPSVFVGSSPMVGAICCLSNSICWFNSYASDAFHWKATVSSCPGKGTDMTVEVRTTQKAQDCWAGISYGSSQ